MAGEFLQLNEVVHFGDPWHGLYRNGFIELPNAALRAPIEGPVSGDCFDVHVPGVLPAITDAGDVAAGRSWLPYGLISGRNHVLYGTELGSMSWIYVAPDSSTWYASGTWLGLNELSLSLAPVFGGAPSQTIVINCSPALSIEIATIGYGRVMDIKQDGSQVAFGHQPASMLETSQDWNLRAASVLTISGTPGGATASLTLLYEINSPTLGGVITTDTRVTIEMQKRQWREIGAWPYVYIYEERPSSAAAWPPPSGYEYSGEFWISSQMRSGKYFRSDIIGYVFDPSGTLTTVRFEQDFTDDGVGWLSPFNEGKYYVGTATNRQWVAVGAVESTKEVQVYVNDGPPTSEQTVGTNAAEYVRYSNRLYGLSVYASGASNFHAPVSPVEQSAVAPVIAPGIPYATFHPVTHAVSFHAKTAGVICWV